MSKPEFVHTTYIETSAGGWPMVIASLKSLLETGHGLNIDPPSAVAKENAHA
jgi:hypothetical protein